MADAIKTLGKGGKGSSSEKTDVFSFEFFRDVKEIRIRDETEVNISVRCESMSPLYDNGEIKMEEVVDYMWNNDQSGVFDFNAEIMLAIERKEMFIRFLLKLKIIPRMNQNLAPRLLLEKNLALRPLLY